MKLKCLQNVSKSITLNNPTKKNILKTESKKKESNNTKTLKYFSSKKMLNFNNLTLSNMSNINNDKQVKKKEEIPQKEKFNDYPRLNVKITKKKNNSLTKEKLGIFTINNHVSSFIRNYSKSNKKTSSLIDINSNKINLTNKSIYSKISNKKSENKNKITNSSLSITPKKNMLKSTDYFTKKLYYRNDIPRSKNKKVKSHKINNITKIKFNLSKSILEKTNKSFKKEAKSIIINKIDTNINIQNEENPNKKILVIDLDETLVHTSFKKIPNPDLVIQLDTTIYKRKLENEKSEELSIKKIVFAFIRIRPGVNEFLTQLSKHYDIYVFSASSKNYLSKIIKNIDKNNIIKRCFCRDDCIMYVEDKEEDFDKPNNKYNYIKDLKKINKDLRNIVFIDNNIISFKLQEKNGIPIKSWFDDYDDIELYKLIPILKNLAGFYDVRIEISKFVKNKTFIWSKSINWLMKNCLNSSYLNDIYIILQKEQQKSDFKIGNLTSNKNQIIHNINNILINLSDLTNNNKSIKSVVDKQIKFNNKEINTKNYNSLNKKSFKQNKTNNNNLKIHRKKLK